MLNGLTAELEDGKGGGGGASTPHADNPTINATDANAVKPVIAFMKSLLKDTTVQHALTCPTHMNVLEQIRNMLGKTYEKIPCSPTFRI
ncbi:hypothetical protein AA106556_0626 [Neokomagataea tanensis NBRC 106556]|uniref:Uncharacterized protein n=1 Tax=Neokomagataea tanensis NBRC 106556 TaxID=1223519 RepID=A0ABQ0QHJ0_9PROT|nr:hypothetical protein AA106556_0626 [Neokomagataea tanensis NBRC 106556]